MKASDLKAVSALAMAKRRYNTVMDTNKSQMFQTKFNVAALFMGPLAVLFISMMQNG